MFEFAYEEDAADVEDGADVLPFPEQDDFEDYGSEVDAYVIHEDAQTEEASSNDWVETSAESADLLPIWDAHNQNEFEAVLPAQSENEVSGAPIDDVRRLDTRKIGIVAGLFAAAIALTFAVSAQPSTQSESTTETTSQTSVPSGQVVMQRDDEYIAPEETTDRNPLGAQPDEPSHAPRHAARPMVSPGPEARLREEAVEARLREDMQASRAPMTFRTQNRRERASTAPAHAGMPIHDGMSPAGMTFGQPQPRERDHRDAFFEARGRIPQHNPNSLEKPVSPYVVMAGTVLDMVLETAVDLLAVRITRFRCQARSFNR